MAVQTSMTSPAPAEQKNIQAIIELERETREKRSLLDRVADHVKDLASGPGFIVVHIVWFAGWLGFNVSSRTAFDPYPFNLLTLVVSLEAIVLTGFVLMAQSRMTQQADRRAHLDLQINLLAEQELTAILKMQWVLAEKAGIDPPSVDPRLEQLRARTDVQKLAAALNDGLASVETGAPSLPASAENPASGVNTRTRRERR